MTRNRLILTTTLLILASLYLPKNSTAQGPPRGGPPPRPPATAHPPATGAEGFRALPPGHHRIAHQGINYFFHEGRFFVQADGSFRDAVPPLGLAVPSLPRSARQVNVRGKRFFELDNIRYEKSGRGYRVVAIL